MKVVHVLRDLRAGGAESVCVSLCNWLAEQGEDVWLVSRPGPLRTRLSPRVTWVEMRGGGTPATDLAVLAKLAMRVSPDIIHTHQRREAVLAKEVARLARCRCVEHAHTMLPSHKLPWLSFRSDHIFAVGDAVAMMVIKDFRRGAEKVTVVGNVPASLAESSPTLRSGRGAGLRIVGIGRLDQQKDPFRFARVVAAMSRVQPGVRADWFGKGPLEAGMAAQISDVDSPVVLRGLSDQIADELDRHDVLVLTSRWEGRPLVILEAMARMRLVVAPDIDGVRELLGYGRGVLVPADATDDAFAQIVIDFLSDADRVRNTVLAAHRFVMDEGSPQKVFGQVARRYREVLGIQ